MARGKAAARKAVKAHRQRAKRLISSKSEYMRLEKGQKKKVTRLAADYQRLHSMSHPAFEALGIRGAVKRLPEKADFGEKFNELAARAQGLAMEEERLGRRADGISRRDAEIAANARRILGAPKKEPKTLLEGEGIKLRSSMRRLAIKGLAYDARLHAKWWADRKPV